MGLKRLLTVVLPELQLAGVIQRYGFIRKKRTSYSTIAVRTHLPTVQVKMPGATPREIWKPKASRIRAITSDRSERMTVWDEANRDLNSLRGSAFRDIQVQIAQIMELASEGVEAAGSGYVFLVAGDPGTGKTALAAILPRLLYGAGIVESSAVLDLHACLPAGGEAGIWVADDADDLLGDALLTTQVGRAFLKTNDKRSVAAMVLIGGPGFADRVARNPKAAFWLMKCEIHDFFLPSLSDDELMMVADDVALDMGFALDGRANEKLRKLIGQVRNDKQRGPSDAHRFDGVGTVIQLLTQAKKNAVRQKRRIIAAEDF